MIQCRASGEAQTRNHWISSRTLYHHAPQKCALRYANLAKDVDAINQKQILYLACDLDLGDTNLGHICNRCDLDFEHMELDLVQYMTNCLVDMDMFAK